MLLEQILPVAQLGRRDMLAGSGTEACAPSPLHLGLKRGVEGVSWSGLESDLLRKVAAVGVAVVRVAVVRIAVAQIAADGAGSRVRRAYGSKRKLDARAG